MAIQSLPTVGWHRGGVLDAAKPPGTVAAAGVALAVAFLIGTGGIGDVRYLQKRNDRGYAFAGIRGTAESPPVARTPAEDLARVRNVLKPAVSDLADLFGVSRQTVYNWANGEQPKAEFAERLADLARAADVIATEGIANPGQLLKRKIADGKNLLEIVASGGSARDAAHNLAAILRREIEQRRHVAEKLAGRQPVSQDTSDYGSPMLDERI